MASISLLGSTRLMSSSGAPAPTNRYVQCPWSSKNACTFSVVEFRSFFPCSWELSKVCMRQELAHWHETTTSSPLAASMARSWTTTWELGTMLCRHTRGTVMRCVGLSGLDQGHSHGWHQFLVSQLSSPISNPPFFFVSTACADGLLTCISIKSSFYYIVNVHRRMPYCSCQKHIKEKKIEVNVLVLMWYFFPFLLQATLLLDAFSKNRASFSRHD